MGLQSRHSERVEGELSAAAGRLGLGDDGWAPVDDHHGLDDGEPARHDPQVDRPPGQPEQLAAAHTGGGEQLQGNVKFSILGTAEIGGGGSSSTTRTRTSTDELTYTVRIGKSALTSAAWRRAEPSPDC